MSDSATLTALDPQGFDLLLSKDQIHSRVAELGEAIRADFTGETLTVVGVLKGAFVFMADLIRVLNVPVQVDFLEISTYGNQATSSGVVKINKDLKHTIEGLDVLIVEDIVDSGLTMRYLTETLSLRNPRTIKTAAFVRKRIDTAQDVKLDYLGFDIEDRFVVGYGLDYAGFYRNLPDIRVLPPAAIKDH